MIFGKTNEILIKVLRSVAGILAALLLVLTAMCGDPREKLYEQYHENVSSTGPLTDEMVVRYVRTYRLLRQRGIEFEQWIAEDPERQKDAFNYIEEAIKEGGFRDYPEFVRVNARIAWAWNMAQARRGMEQQKNLNDWAVRETDSGIETIREVLRDPDVPEDVKVDLRKQIEELEAQKVEIRATWETNKGWAEWAMKLTEPLTNEEEIAVVLRHERELMEVYTGLSAEEIDAIHEHSMTQLGIE